MGGPFHKEELPQEISEVNVVPLADVSLVLLIILLVLSPMMTESMLHVKTAGKSADTPPPPLPEEVQPPPKPPELVLAVDLGPNGIAVGSRLFRGPGEFIDFMKAELARRTEKKVFLSPHPDVPHGLVVHTLELIKSCGADSVALVQVVDPSAPEEENGQVRAPAPAP